MVCRCVEKFIKSKRSSENIRSYPFLINMSNGEIPELEGSELGTKEYWEQSYEREIQNYNDHGDVGEIWFDEDSQIRVIKWILKNDDIAEDFNVIDLGCGNGMFLIELGREGFKNLLGVDYSPKAIELAAAIAKDQDLPIEYKVADLLSNECMSNLGTFKIIHDKGTYDAISLNPDHPKEKREQYIANTRSILADDGFFIITSCNWTESELIASFQGTFEKLCTIPTPTFRFGGKEGSVVTSVVFKK